MKAMKVLDTALKIAGAGLVIWAVARELRTPADQRRWTGMLGGFVPYDFRTPTFERVRERYWNPADSRLFTPTVFGVGWGLNVARLAGRDVEPISTGEA